jgi:hypothetical protein
LFDDWLDILLRGTFEVNLPTLILAQGNSQQFCGSGRSAWQANAGIRILAETDGAEPLRENFGRSGVAPGQLIPHETYLSTCGRTQAGWDVSTNPVPLDGYKVYSDSPYVVWDFTTRGLTLTRASVDRERSGGTTEGKDAEGSDTRSLSEKSV